MSSNNEITKEPSPILREKLDAIVEITQEIRECIDHMRKIMIKAHGVGLAANQIGKNLALFVIDKDLAEKYKVPDYYINPEITELSKEEDELEEGCLSIPDYWQIIKRSKKVRLKTLTENGEKMKIKARGFLARVYQHEVDHLMGKLIKDHINH